MGLFDKKNCDICGNKIGMLGNRKLDDGNMCKECTKKLSPFFSERRHSTVAEIKSQLAYRETNKPAVAAFNVTRTYGLGTKIYIDDNARKVIVSSSKKWQSENPDVLDFSQITGCATDIQSGREEETYRNNEGREVSYSPPRYVNTYDFYTVIYTNSPWFNEIRFRLNPGTVRENSSSGLLGNLISSISNNSEYQRYEALGQEIKDAMSQLQSSGGSQPVGATPQPAGAAPQPAPGNAGWQPAPVPAPVSGPGPVQAQSSSLTCPHCGAATVPTASGCCEYCRGAV